MSREYALLNQHSETGPDDGRSKQKPGRGLNVWRANFAISQVLRALSAGAPVSRYRWLNRIRRGL